MTKHSLEVIQEKHLMEPPLKMLKTDTSPEEQYMNELAGNSTTKTPEEQHMLDLKSIAFFQPNLEFNHNTLHQPHHNGTNLSKRETEQQQLKSEQHTNSTQDMRIINHEKEDDNNTSSDSNNLNNSAAEEEEDFPWKKQHSQQHSPQMQLLNNNSAGIKPFKCEMPNCDKSYKKLNGLISHHYSVHVTIDLEDPKPFKCGNHGCNRSYRNANGLAYHLENAHSTMGEKPQLYNESNNDSSREELRKNSNSPVDFNDTSNKSFPCPYHGCDKVYKNSNGLSYHLSKGRTNGHDGQLDEDSKHSNQSDDSKNFHKIHQQHNLKVTQTSGRSPPNFKCSMCANSFMDYKE
ncbi:hypothetical protein HK099_006617 [Clydaea vesicula]|uniref:C2H2-type domain-containing protein n=1 Tax=Clydaea vesicula TaxID=447962 RepID=A0AAD5XYZ1_9FUNG|nr:hypothetical protein HK099_006617 [Clydaea vesicula]